MRSFLRRDRATRARDAAHAPKGHRPSRTRAAHLRAGPGTCLSNVAARSWSTSHGPARPKARHLLFERLARAPEARRHRSARDLEQRGDLARRELLELEEHEDRAKIEIHLLE